MDNDTIGFSEIKEELDKVKILIRTNNMLLSRFILELSQVRKQFNIPNKVVFFKFYLLKEEYNQLVNEFGKNEVDKALYRLDRLLLTNKQDCPNNIASYTRANIKRNRKLRAQYAKRKQESKD